MSEKNDTTHWIQAGARNLVGWHESQLRALGRECRGTAALWTCSQSAPPIYHAAITLSSPANHPGLLAQIEQFVGERAGETFSLRDSWATLDLGALGFRPAETTEPWYVRTAGPNATVQPPPGLMIEPVTDAAALEEFGRTSLDGFEVPEQDRPGPFGWHAPGALHDRRMRFFAGRIDGRVVSVSMAYVGDDMVGIYGVATPPEYRRRGFGEALTWAALETAPHLPAVLSPSEMGASLYRKMGFREVGQFRIWVHEGSI